MNQDSSINLVGEKRLNFILVSLFVFLIAFNLCNIAYSLSNYTKNSTAENVARVENLDEEEVDFLAKIFNNSITSMLISTLVIALVGVVIAKLRGLKKKMDTIEILTKSIIKLKNQGIARETEYKAKIEEMEKKIEAVQKDTTEFLIKYLAENKKT